MKKFTIFIDKSKIKERKVMPPPTKKFKDKKKEFKKGKRKHKEVLC